MVIQAIFEIPPIWAQLIALDLREPMRKIGRNLETSVVQNYNQQRSPAGIAWIPSQRAKKDGGKTLIDTGRMLASLTFVSGNNWIEVGYPSGRKNIPAWLHFGVPRNNVPAREHLGLRDEDEQMIMQNMRDYFLQLLA